MPTLYTHQKNTADLWGNLILSYGELAVTDPVKQMSVALMLLSIRFEWGVKSPQKLWDAGPPQSAGGILRGGRLPLSTLFVSSCYSSQTNMPAELMADLYGANTERGWVGVQRFYQPYAYFSVFSYFYLLTLA